VENRDSSVCDRLRNATARAVRDVHRLMGDPTVVGLTASDEARAQYFSILDEMAAKALGECKVWVGGTQYLGKKCVSDQCRNLRCDATMLVVPACLLCYVVFASDTCTSDVTVTRWPGRTTPATPA
jgi:hypothetical protein